MDRNRNVIVKVEDKEYGFRISTWVLKQTQQKTGCKGVVELFNKIGLDDGNIDIDSFIVFLMESHNEFNHYVGEDKKITEREAADMIDDIGGVVVAMARISEGLEAYVPKNPQPPQMVGETSR